MTIITQHNQLIYAPAHIGAPEPPEKPQLEAFGNITAMTPKIAVGNIQHAEERLYKARRFFYRYYNNRQKQGVEDDIQEAYRRNIQAIDICLSLMKQLIAQMLLEIRQKKLQEIESQQGGDK